MFAVLTSSICYQLADVDKPVDKSRWHMNPQTVNAYYNPTTNEICFPAAILQPPFFNPDADDAVSVQPGQEITYTLAFNPVRVNAKNIVVTDLVPEGLELVAGSITFTPAGSSTPQVIDDAAYNDTSRVLTWPSYDQEVSG